MEANLDKFNVFIIENANLEDALVFCNSMGIDKADIEAYETLAINDVRSIKDRSYILSDTKKAFVFGNIKFDAQNALLKLLEEPYRMSYFVFYGDVELLDTIKSRAQIIKKKKNYEKNDKLLNAVRNNNVQEMIEFAAHLQAMNKDEVISVLEGLSRQLSFDDNFTKSDIINRELIKFKRFNLNSKLFLVALFSKLYGGVLK
jgi:DNA polymerase III delta prime subunit